MQIVLLVLESFQVALFNFTLHICFLDIFSMRHDTIFTKIYYTIAITVMHTLNRKNQNSSDECKSYLDAKCNSILMGRCD